MRTDAAIQKDVQDQLQWEALLPADAVQVSVKNGIVTLSGQVDSYARKLAAEKAAGKVFGVKALIAHIGVNIAPAQEKTDEEIAEAVLDALRWNAALAVKDIRVRVEKAVVTLEGEVEWSYLRDMAVTAVENLAGIRSVLNHISVQAHTPHPVSDEDIRKKIEAAFLHHAVIDAAGIKVEVASNKVMLEGLVRSFAEKEDAENIALCAPGISSVVNRLEVALPGCSTE